MSADIEVGLAPNIAPAIQIEAYSQDIDSLIQNDLDKQSKLDLAGSFNESRDVIITDDMIQEEKRMEDIIISDEKKLRLKMLEEDKKLQEEHCFKRLHLLLSRSSIYAKFLAEKLQKNEAMKLKKAQRLESREKSKEGHKENHTANLKEKVTRATNVGVKRKASQSPLKIHQPSKKKVTVDAIDVYKKSNMAEIVCTVDENQEDFSKVVGLPVTETTQPVLMTGGTMYPYQLEGYEWMKALYENGVNGILADEMGLGKTIQCIAFIANLVEMGVSGPFFVCAPLSTLPNWYAEFKRFTPDIPVILYHGPKDVRIDLRKKIYQKSKVGNVMTCPVILTSYQVALFDSKKLGKFIWKMLVIDEAHRIKNFECKLISELKTYNASHRLLMTGTPLQNNLTELWSLLNFILPEIFDDLQVFQSWFDISNLRQKSGAQEIIAKEQEKQLVSTIHQILNPFLLRRTKLDINLKLPPRKEVIVHAPFSELQEKYYAGALNKTIRSLCSQSEVDNDISEVSGKRVSKKTDFFGTKDGIDRSVSAPYPSGEWQDSEVNIKLGSIFMLLRKVCNHPYLISYPLDHSGEYRVDEDMVRTSGKLRVLDLMLPELKKRGHKILLFSQFVTMLQILEDYCHFRGYKYNSLNGNMSLEDRQAQLKEFSEDADQFIFLISTKAGGLGLNIIAADTVVFYDSDWNPQGDIQAQDRCHRIGQTKPVVVYRLLVPSTADEKIYECAQAKRKLEKVIIHSASFPFSHNLLIP